MQGEGASFGRQASTFQMLVVPSPQDNGPCPWPKSTSSDVNGSNGLKAMYSLSVAVIYSPSLSYKYPLLLLLSPNGNTIWASARISGS